MASGDGSTVTLIVVRHGETDWNLEGRIQGQLDGDVPLNERGLGQAQALARRLRRCGADTIVSSDLARARQTAEAISRATGLGVEYAELLRERHLGCFERLTMEEIAERFPAALADYMADRWDYRPEGGESRRDLWERSLRAMEWCFERACACPRLTAIVVTHGGVIQSALPQLAGHAGEVEPNIKIDNCAVSVVTRAGGFTTIRMANDSAHSPSQRRGDPYWTLR